MAEYLVAFETTEATGAPGIRTWTSYKSKEDFEKSYDDNMKKNYKVLEQGITPERGVELSQSTSPEADFRASLARAKDEKGNINCEMLRLELGNAIYCRPPESVSRLAELINEFEIKENARRAKSN